MILVNVRVTQRKGSKNWRVEAEYKVVDPETGKEKRVRKYKTIGPKRQAEAYAKELRLRETLAVETTPQTFEEFLREWFNEHKHRLAPKTQLSYSQIIEDYIIPHLGSIKLDLLAPIHLSKFYSQMMESGSKRGGGVSATTALYMHRIIHRALEAAVQWGKISRNPADMVDAPRPQKTNLNILTAEQVEQIAAIAQEPYKTAILIAFWTGMRAGEILSLTWDRITEDTIEVRTTIQWIPGEGPITKPPKYHSVRNVPIPQRLRRHLDTLERTDGLVIKNKEGGPLHISTLYHAFVRYAKRCGFEGVRFHDLRHSHVTALLEMGADVNAVKEQVGHHSPAFTLAQYGHVTPKMREVIKSKLDDLTKASE